MDIANLCPTIEDVVKLEVYSAVDRENKDLERKDPREYHRLCAVAYENVHTLRLETLKKIKRISCGRYILRGLEKHSQGYGGLTGDEQKERNRKAFSLVSKMCCKDRSSILGYWREYNQMRKSGD